MSNSNTPENFHFEYLPAYASYLLNTKLDEFILVGIRFSRQANLPLIKPLSRVSEIELVELGRENNREMLQALPDKKIYDLISLNSHKWIDTSLEILKKDKLGAEDLTLGFYLRRKIFTYFLEAYSPNVVLHKLIIAELDNYTSQEEIVSVNIYLEKQSAKMEKMKEAVASREALLNHAEETYDVGFFVSDFVNPNNSFYTPRCTEILELTENNQFEDLISHVHPEDQAKVIDLNEQIHGASGEFETEFRYLINGKEKHIFTRGIVISEKGIPVTIHGTIQNLPMPYATANL